MKSRKLQRKSTRLLMTGLTSWNLLIMILSRRRLMSLPTEVQRLIGRIVQGNLDSIQELFSSELQRCHGNIADLRSRRSGAGSIKVGLEQSQPHLRLNFEENEDSIHAFPKAKVGSSPNGLRNSRFPSALATDRTSKRQWDTEGNLGISASVNCWSSSRNQLWISFSKGSLGVSITSQRHAQALPRDIRQ